MRAEDHRSMNERHKRIGFYIRDFLQFDRTLLHALLQYGGKPILEEFEMLSHFCLNLWRQTW